MKPKIQITLSRHSLGQLLEGLCERLDAWSKTADFLESGYNPDDGFAPEYASDAEEARAIARHYEQIVSEVKSQLSQQIGDNERVPSTETPDPAAIFAAATSLWQECQEHAAVTPDLNLSDEFAGIDGLMREVMRIATKFESWSCAHVDFKQLTDVWPYMLEDRFGKACLSVLTVNDLSEFDEHDCRRVAARLRLIFR